MKTGDYARSSDGDFGKIVRINNSHDIELEDSWVSYDEEDLKSSPNIIDLIEVLDLVYVDISPDDCGGIIVPRIAETERELNSLKLLIENKDYILKSIITHEQIENMEYKVKE